MENNNIFQNLINNTSKKQKLALVFIIVLFFLIIIISIIFNIINQPAISINNLDKYTNKITSEQKKELGDSLWSVIKNTKESQDNNNKKVKDIEVRDGTFEEKTDIDQNLISFFIIDIDSLKQSYQISVISRKDNQILPGDITIECPGYQLMKYKETECHGTYTTNNSLDLYLPYTGKINDHYFTVSEKYYIGSDEVYYEIKFDTCNNLPELFEQAKSQTINYLSENGVDASNLTFELYNNIKVCKNF